MFHLPKNSSVSISRCIISFNISCLVVLWGGLLIMLLHGKINAFKFLSAAEQQKIYITKYNDITHYTTLEHVAVNAIK